VIVLDSFDSTHNNHSSRWICLLILGLLVSIIHRLVFDVLQMVPITKIGMIRNDFIILLLSSKIDVIFWFINGNTSLFGISMVGFIFPLLVSLISISRCCRNLEWRIGSISLVLSLLGGLVGFSTSYVEYIPGGFSLHIGWGVIPLGFSILVVAFWARAKEKATIVSLSFFSAFVALLIADLGGAMKAGTFNEGVLGGGGFGDVLFSGPIIISFFAMLILEFTEIL
jgi:hypothetical protein